MNDAAIRRRPQQERSKDRVETILDAALALILESGAENLAMREVARRAGVPISSVYQYFPSKSAILRELADRNLRKVAQMMQDELAQVFVEFGGRPSVAQSVHRLIDAYFRHYRDHPEAVAVWAGGQADPALKQLDVIDTRRTAEFLTPSIMMSLGLVDHAVAFALALLVADVTGSAARLALALASPLRETIIEMLKTMVTTTLEAYRVIA